MTSSSGASLVQGHAVTRIFSRGGDRLTALDQVSFQINPGDQIALAGRSGSGKSTLLNLIAGLDRPSEGMLTWPLLGSADLLRPQQIAVMFQNLSLVPSLTVQENVALPLDLAKPPEDRDRRVLVALDRFGLGDLASKLPEELSGGQAQRVSLARATVTDPRLIIADEPTGQIDHETGTRVISALRQWAEDHEAALLVATHDSEISSQFPYQWRLAHGRLSAEYGEILP